MNFKLQINFVNTLGRPNKACLWVTICDIGCTKPFLSVSVHSFPVGLEPCYLMLAPKLYLSFTNFPFIISFWKLMSL